MSDKVNILGVKVDKVNIEEASDIIINHINTSDNTISVFTPNSEIIMKGYKDEKFKDVLNSSQLLTADGIGVVYASKIVKNPIKERCAGYDLACRVCEKAKDNPLKLYLFGSKPGVCEMAKENIEKKYPGVSVVGLSDGYFDDEKEKKIICDINEKSPDILFVCLGAPKQENWIYNNKTTLNAKVCMGIGGSLDVFAGNVKRAPDFFVNHGLEWFYRLIKQPSRFVRMLELPRFALKVLIKGKKYPQDK